MRQLVRDETVQPVRGLIDGKHDPVPPRFRERTDALRASPRDDVLLLELAVRLEDDERHERRQVMPQIGADLLIGALGIARHALEMLLQVRVVIDLEVVGRVDVPVELVVLDPVLAVVRNERALCAHLGGDERDQHEREGGGQHVLGTATNPAAHHLNHLVAASGRGRSWRGNRFILP